MLKEKIKEIQTKKEMAFLKSFDKSQTFLVGGAIRDFILQKPTKDFDFVVIDKTGEEIEKKLQQYGKVEEVESRAFGVFKFIPKNSNLIFDIALPRIDHWTGLGYKDLKTQIGVSLKEDLSRRDFTINALAINLNGELVDEFGGIQDLNQKLIRAVGDPNERFREDPSRILRGLRLACVLDFKIEKKTLAAMINLAEEITKPAHGNDTRVAPEVMAGEFLKGFSANSTRIIKLLDKTGILKLLLPEIEKMKGVKQPEIFHAEGDVFNHTLIALEKLKNLETNPKLVKSAIPIDPKSIHAKLAILFHDLGKPKTFRSAKETGDRIRFTGHDIAGAKMLEIIFKRLPLSVFEKDTPLHVDKEKLIWLVKHHMVCVAVDPETIRLSTMEKYFFNPDNRGGELLALSFADISATIPKSGNPDFSLFNGLLKKIKSVAEVINKKQGEEALPHFLDGTEIMKILNLKPGPKIGKIKNELRDLQLAGKLKSEDEAIKYLENNNLK
ncbi:MAG: HD domain-containing protein [Patescibacteria group bacterium]|nr:HD domain-containing protein [Patescibacteria group bacterium]